MTGALILLAILIAAAAATIGTTCWLERTGEWE